MQNSSAVPAVSMANRSHFHRTCGMRAASSCIVCGPLAIRRSHATKALSLRGFFVRHSAAASRECFAPSMLDCQAAQSTVARHGLRCRDGTWPPHRRQADQSTSAGDFHARLTTSPACHDRVPLRDLIECHDHMGLCAKRNNQRTAAAGTVQRERMFNLS